MILVYFDECNKLASDRLADHAARCQIHHPASRTLPPRLPSLFQVFGTCFLRLRLCAGQPFSRSIVLLLQFVQSQSQERTAFSAGSSFQNGL